MNCFDLFKLLFYALDDQYDKKPNEELGNFLSSMNPFLFEGEGSAAIDVYENFKKMFYQKFERIASEKEGYDFAKSYIKSLNIKCVEDAFDNVSFDAWNDAIDSK